MAIQAGSNFEVSDNDGSTVVYSGTATTTPSSQPSSPGNVISGVGINNTGSQSLEISMDGGTTYYTVKKGVFFSWNVKGQITQIEIRTPSGSTTYQLIVNFEDQ